MGVRFPWGDLGKDPDLRYLSDGIPVAAFPLATSEVVKKDGRNLDHTEWHNFDVWWKLAETAAKYG